MPDYSAEALGEVIRVLRKEQNQTQQELGAHAGYKGGAGVSISRLESGQMTPSSERLEDIARALAVQPDELIARAVAITNRAKTTSSRGAKGVTDRDARIDQLAEAREQLVRHAEALKIAHERAKDAFLLRFHDCGRRLSGAPPANPSDITTRNPQHADDIATEASLQIEFTKVGIQQALTRSAEPQPRSEPVGDSDFETLTSLVSLGVLSLGPALASSGGTAAAVKALQKATSMRPALLGAAGGVAAVVGIVAAGAAVGWQQATAKSSRKKQQEQARLEAVIAQTQPSMDALRDFIPRATEILDYIAVHASHALNRWETKIGPAPCSWSSLGPDEQQRYHDFVEIAAAQLAVATIRPGDLLTTQGDELERAKELSNQVLTQAWQVITSHV